MHNSSNSNLIFKTAPPHTCGYLPDQQATTRFTPLSLISHRQQYTLLNEQGYRRSGAFIYRPACLNCSACIPLRTLTDHFSFSRSQRRCWNKNRDLVVTETTAKFTSEYYALYKLYIDERHQDGEMYPSSRQQFIDFLCQGNRYCSFYEFRLNDGTLIAVTVADQLDNGLSLLYTFFSTKAADRSLGTYCVLWLIQDAKKNQQPYVYLGYWIRTCDKMSYKCKFKTFPGFY